MWVKDLLKPPYIINTIPWQHASIPPSFNSSILCNKSIPWYFSWSLNPHYVKAPSINSSYPWQQNTCITLAVLGGRFKHAWWGIKSGDFFIWGQHIVCSIKWSVLTESNSPHTLHGSSPRCWRCKSLPTAQPGTQPLYVTWTWVVCQWMMQPWMSPSTSMRCISYEIHSEINSTIQMHTYCRNQCSSFCSVLRFSVLRFSVVK